MTTLSVNALGPDLPDEAREPILRWLLDQQYKEVHPYTNAPLSVSPLTWSHATLVMAVREDLARRAAM